MAVQIEKIYCACFRIFEWKEDYFPSNIMVSESEGLFMFRAHTGTGGDDEGYQSLVEKIYEDRVFRFDLKHLLSPKSSFFDHFILDTQFFLKDSSNALALSDATFSYIFGRFQFTNGMHDSLSSRKSKIVILVDVFAKRFVENIDQENTLNSFSRDEDFVYDYDDEVEEEYFYNCEYGNYQDEKQEMDDDDEEEEEVEDMEDDSMDLNVEERHEVENEELRMNDDDDDDDVTNMAESDRDHYMKIISTLRSSVGIEAIETCEPQEVLKVVEDAVKMNTLTNDDGTLFTDSCSICLERFLMGADVATMPCSHRFHTDCIFEWLPNNKLCPLCRSLCATVVHI